MTTELPVQGELYFPAGTQSNMNSNIQYDPFSAVCASHCAAKVFCFLKFNLDKFESGNIQQQENLSVTWKTYVFDAGTQAEVRESLDTIERHFSPSHFLL